MEFGQDALEGRLEAMNTEIGLCIHCLRAATVLKQDNECMAAVGDLRLGLGQ